MPAILHDRRYYLQRIPRNRARVNYAHPAAAGIVAAYVPVAQGAGMIYDVVTGRRGSTATTWVTRHSGPAAMDPGTGSVSNGDSTQLDFLSGDWTVAAWYNAVPPANGEYLNIFGRYDYVAEANNRGWLLQCRPPDAAGPRPGFCGLVFRNSNVLNYTLGDSDGSVSARDGAMMMSTTGSVRHLYRNDMVNRIVDGANTGTNLNPLTTSAPLVFGGSATTGKLAVYLALAWARGFSVANAIAWIEDPMGLIVDEAPVAYFLPMGPVAVTLLESDGQAAGTSLAAAFSTTLGGPGIERFATVDIDDLENFYDGRVLSDPVVTRGLVEPFYGPIRHENTTVVLANRDGGLTDQFLAQDGWRGRPLVIRRFDRFTLEMRTAWVGIVSESALDGDAGTIRLTGTNVDLSILEQPIPTAIVKNDEFPAGVDIGRSKPIIFGTARQMPLPYINDDTENSCFDYLVGYDTAWSDLTVLSVWRVGGTTGSTVSTVQCDPSEYVVSTTDWPGYTTIRFALRQVGFQEVAAGASSGFLPILATVRNEVPAQHNPIGAIREMFENSTWGGGKTVNGPAFDAAFALVDSLGPYLVDGAMIAPEPMKNWLTELCAFRGIRLAVNESGEWYPIVDEAQVAPVMLLRDGPGDGERNLLGVGERSFADVNNAVKNAHISYRENLTALGTFREVAKFSRVVNAAFGADRPYTNRFVWQHQTADRILDYLAKRLILDQQRIHLTTGQAGRALEPGQLVQATADRIGLSDDILEVVSVEESVDRAELTSRPWDAEIYVYSPWGGGDTGGEEDPHTTPPSGPTNIALNDNPGGGVVTIGYDMIDTASDPTLVFYAAWIDYRLDSETTWMRWLLNQYTPAGAFIPGFGGTGLEQTVTGLTPNTDYVFRVTSQNVVGLEAYSDELAVHTAP